MSRLNLLDIRRRLHRIPEPGFEEFKTQASLLEVIASLPQDRLEVATWRTGILVHVRGKNPRQRLGFRVDMDGLPIGEETGVPFASLHPGWMHACGHDMHMTIGLGVLEHLALHQLEDDVLVIFQPAEEGPGGALPMLASEEFAAWRPDVMIGLHVAPEYPVGTVATRSGILFANTSELFIDLVGQGGHAAFPHRANDMVVAACQLVGQLQTIVARNINPLDSAVITIGKITGGTKQNIIAETARLEGTMRSLSASTMQSLKSRVEQVVAGIGQSFGCQTTIDYGSNYMQVFNQAVLVEEFMDWVDAGDLAQLVRCDAAMTGEDFGYFLAEIPGFMFWLGVNTEYGLHHAKLAPHEEAIDVAVRVVTGYLTMKAGQSEPER